jgi:hypothetical protein
MKYPSNRIMKLNTEKPSYKKYLPYLVGFLLGFLLTNLILYLMMKGGF